jgi:hypothetical protein
MALAHTSDPLNTEVHHILEMPKIEKDKDKGI